MKLSPIPLLIVTIPLMASCAPLRAAYGPVEPRELEPGEVPVTRPGTYAKPGTTYVLKQKSDAKGLLKARLLQYRAQGNGQELVGGERRVKIERRDVSRYTVRAGDRQETVTMDQDKRRTIAVLPSSLTAARVTSRLPIRDRL